MTDQSASSDRRRPKISKGFIPALAFAVFGLVGGVVASIFLLQSEAEDPAARTPTATALGFIDAAFVQRDATRLLPYICDTWGAQSVLQVVDAHVAEGTSVAPGLVETVNQAASTVRLRVKIVIRDSVAVDDQWWQLDLVNRGQWRVCGAELVENPDEPPTNSPSATPTTPG